MRHPVPQIGPRRRAAKAALLGFASSLALALEFGPAHALDPGGGNVQNHGTLVLGGSGPSATLNVNGDFQNAGDGNLTIENGSSLVATGLFTNAGGTVIGAGSTLQAQTISQSGAMTVAQGGGISASTFNVSGGVLQGSGLINLGSGVLNLTAGTLRPGGDGGFGALKINGTLNQTGGVFDEQIGAHSSGVLVLVGGGAGAVKLGGSLAVDLVNGFSPTIGETYGIVTSGSRTFNGTWSNAPQGISTLNGLNWKVDYGKASPTEISLTYEGIAFPTSAGQVVNVPNIFITQDVSQVIHVPGVLNITQGSQVILNGAPGIVSTGTIAIDPTSHLTVNGTVANSGSIVNNGALDVSILQNSGAIAVKQGALTVNGPATNFTTGSLNIDSGAHVLIQQDLNTDGSLMIPGADQAGFASVTVNGNLNNTSNGHIDLVSTCDPENENCLHRGGATSLQVVQDAYNSGRITAGEAVMYTFMAIGPYEPPEVDPSFYNRRGGVVSFLGAHDGMTLSNGSFFNQDGASLTLGGLDDVVMASNAFVNDGRVALSGSGARIVAASFSNTGAVSVGAGARIEATGAGGYTQTGGVTQGAGEIRAREGGMAVTGGTIVPGGLHTPGTLTVDGNYAQGALADLVIDIRGPDAGDVSLLDVLGAASLDGEVTFDFDFTPIAGEKFTFLVAHAGDLAGKFARVSFEGLRCLGCSLFYDVAAGTVTLDFGEAFAVPAAAAAPEPATWVLLGMGLVTVAAARLKPAERRSAREVKGLRQ